MVKLLSAVFTNKFKKLPQTLRDRFDNKLSLILSNPNHPGLHSRKMGGTNCYEDRLTKHYRFTYMVTGDDLCFLTIGPHDEGLGKK